MSTAAPGARRSALGGSAGAMAVLLLWPALWPAGLGCVLVGAYGVRVLSRDGPGGAFIAIRWLATSIGALAAAVLLFALLNLVFGGAWT